MKLKATYDANLAIEVPAGIHVETRVETGHAPGQPFPPKMMRIWSTSTVSSEDAIAQISLMMRALEHALTAGGNDV